MATARTSLPQHPPSTSFPAAAASANPTSTISNPLQPPKDSGFLQPTDPDAPSTSATVPFREIIPPRDHPKIAGIGAHDARSWCASRRQIPAPGWLIGRLERARLDRPLRGFTVDGVVREGVYGYGRDEGAPVGRMVAAADRLIERMTDAERARTCWPTATRPEDVDEMRLWSNPELYVNPGGLRLDEEREEVVEAVWAVLKTSLSEKGWEKVWGCCVTNGFLGKLVGGEKVLGERSYNFRLFGTPSETEPWGWSFFGHHLCLTTVVRGGTMVVGPCFLGAEPDEVDEGEYAGLKLFEHEEWGALRLMQSLPRELQEKATLSKSMRGEDLPEGRWNPFDERHLGGARQDNRVVPYEGCPVSLMPPEAQQQVVELYKTFNEYLPEPVLAHRTRNFESHLTETYFAWIGGCGDQDPFYYRIHSPVAFLEFDCHCGIFLTNTSPARCHIHTVNRLPNRGDYGRALLEQYS